MQQMLEQVLQKTAFWSCLVIVILQLGITTLFDALADNSTDSIIVQDSTVSNPKFDEQSIEQEEYFVHDEEEYTPTLIQAGEITILLRFALLYICCMHRRYTFLLIYASVFCNVCCVFMVPHYNSSTRRPLPYS